MTARPIHITAKVSIQRDSNDRAQVERLARELHSVVRDYGADSLPWDELGTFARANYMARAHAFLKREEVGA